MIAVLVIAASCFAASLAWLGLLALVPDAWAPHGCSVHIQSAAVGVFWTASVLPAAAHLAPNGLLAESHRLAPALKLTVYGVVLTVGSAASLSCL